MSVIVYLQNPSVQNPKMTGDSRPTFAALLVRTPAPIARDSNIGLPMTDRPHLHLCTPLYLPHYQHLCHVLQTQYCLM